MNEFNILYNLTNLLINNKQTSAQNPKAQAEVSENLQLYEYNMQAQNLKSTYNQIFESDSLSNMLKMDNETITKYLQSLLDMPETMEQLVKELVTNSTTSKFAKLLAGSSVDINEIAKLLNQNSKVAIDKVLKIISASINSANNDIKQFKDVLNILKEIQHTSSNIESNSLKELLLLYIPLNIQAFEDKAFSNITSEDQEKIKNSTLTIIFQTLSFKNVLITVNESDEQFLVGVSIDESFPKEKYEKIVLSMCERMNSTIVFEYSAKLQLDNKKDIQNFKVFSSSVVSIKLLYLTHVLIKTLFKIDSDFDDLAEEQ